MLSAGRTRGYGSVGIGRIRIVWFIRDFHVKMIYKNISLRNVYNLSIKVRLANTTGMESTATHTFGTQEYEINFSRQKNLSFFVFLRILLSLLKFPFLEKIWFLIKFNDDLELMIAIRFFTFFLS